MKFAAMLFACAFFTFLPFRAQGAPDTTENLAITHLIQHVRESGLQFIRNGQSYTAADAADHMQTKLKYALDKLKTADEFITHVASRSSMTKTPYYVVLADGKREELGPWLYVELEKYRALRKK